MVCFVVKVKWKLKLKKVTFGTSVITPWVLKRKMKYLIIYSLAIFGVIYCDDSAIDDESRAVNPQKNVGMTLNHPGIWQIKYILKFKKKC